MTCKSIGVAPDGFVRIFLNPIFVVSSAKGNGMRNEPINIGFDQLKDEYIKCYVACNKNYVDNVANFLGNWEFFNRRPVKEVSMIKIPYIWCFQVQQTILDSFDERLIKVAEELLGDQDIINKDLVRRFMSMWQQKN